MSLQPLLSNASSVKSNSSKKQVLVTTQQMEEQCAAIYTSLFSQMKTKPTLTFMHASSQRNKNEVEVFVNFVRSDTPETVKYRCIYKNGSLETHGTAS